MIYQLISNKWIIKASGFFVLALLFFFREFDFFSSPRMWAEEGKIFYSYARHHSVYEVFSNHYVGYLTLYNSLVSLLQVHVFPVEYAATVSTYLAFIALLLPICIIFVLRFEQLGSFKRKMVACIIIVLLVPPELWMNTTNAHFIFTLVTFLILISDTTQLSGFRRIFTIIVLLIANLTGPGSILFTPFFIFKAFRSKHKSDMLIAGVQLLCAVFQGSIILYSILFANHYERFSLIEGNVFINYIIDHFSFNLSIFGQNERFILGCGFVILFLFLFIRETLKRNNVLLFVIFLFVSFLSTLGSLGMNGSPRYGYISSCIFFLILAINSRQLFLMRFRIISFFITILLCFVVLFNAINFRPSISYIYKGPNPKWKLEVEKWRKDSSYLPRIHPNDEMFWYVEM